MEAHQKLEHEFARFIGFPPECVVACSSGTAACHLALESLRLPLGSEVVTADFSMIAVPRAISLAGLVPVFVDCCDDLNANPSLLREACSARTRAVLLVSIYGRHAPYGGPLGWPVLTDGLLLIEDLSEAHGIPPYPDTDVAFWSCYKNKIVAGEEAGIIAFRQPEKAWIAKQLRSLGFTEAHDFRHLPRGMNYRLANCLAEKVLASLDTYEANLAERRRLEAAYEAECPPEWKMPPRAAPWIYDIRIPGLASERQAEIIRSLNAEGIVARHFFYPMSCQEEYRDCRVVGTGKAMAASREGLYLSLQPQVAKAENAARAFEVIAGAAH